VVRRMQMRFQSTILFVSDIEQSKEFYRTHLGQEVVQDGIFNVGFASGLSLYQKSAECSVYCDFEAPDDQLPREIRERMEAEEKAGPGEPDMEIYFETDEILEVADRVYEAGIRLLHPVVEKPWGQRVLRFYDPDHHLIEVGESMDAVVRRYAGAHHAPDEIAKKTYMSVDAVNRILDARL
jgi:catechol 2,3-dioxygenase-like lactoylglutathione lyase family enzyme